MLDDHWIGSFRLRSVKGVLRCINGRKRFGFVDEPLSLGVAGLGGKHRDLDVRLQRFPGLMAYRACSTSCTMLFDFSGDNAINSLSAAITIQNWAEDRISKDMVIGAGVTLV